VVGKEEFKNLVTQDGSAFWFQEKESREEDREIQFHKVVGEEAWEEGLKNRLKVMEYLMKLKRLGIKVTCRLGEE